MDVGLQRHLGPVFEPHSPLCLNPHSVGSRNHGGVCALATPHRFGIHVDRALASFAAHTCLRARCGSRSQVARPHAWCTRYAHGPVAAAGAPRAACIGNRYRLRSLSWCNMVHRTTACACWRPHSWGYLSWVWHQAFASSLVSQARRNHPLAWCAISLSWTQCVVNPS
jgi:hypothetical protein